MTHNTHYFIAIAGNIGTGKSTLTNLLAQHFGWKPFLEANAENPYLADFYQDMQRWSFHSQVFFLGKRLEHHRQLLDYDGSVIQDRTVYEDAEIFARNLFIQGQMSERDYEAYYRLHKAISSFLPPPDLILYLEADIPTLQRRIQLRGRDFEQAIDPEYLMQLNQLYTDWADRWVASPLLRIDMNRLDFVEHQDDFERIIEEIQSILLPIS